MNDETTPKKKVYIAGKVTGEDFQKCFDKFQATAELLTEFGYVPLNPMYIVHKSTPWEESMDILKPHLINADIILFLPDWKESEGAQLERHWAIKYKKEIAEYSELLGMAKEEHANAKH